MDYLIKGKKVEINFASYMENVIYSTKEQDINEHWDIEADYKGGRKKFDIKGIKKQNRYDSFYDENFHWFELSNVHGGRRTGSLYGNIVDYFVFEVLDYFIICDKIVLQEFIENKCKGKKIETTKDPYTLYRRDGRKDIIVKVKTLDLFYIADKIIKK